MILALCLLAIAIGCYSVSQLQQHGKLKGQKDDESFWGEKSWQRKYEYNERLVRVERWFTSTTLTVAFTDGYHAMQSLSFILLSASISLLSGINFFIIWLGVIFVHFLTYKILSK